MASSRYGLAVAAALLAAGCSGNSFALSTILGGSAPLDTQSAARRLAAVPAMDGGHAVYEAMVSFLRDVLGLRTNFEEPTTVEFTTAEGDEIQVMGPGDRYDDFFAAHATGPVPLFEVDDVASARGELEAAGVELVGSAGRDSRWEWLHFRAPDGNLYELASRLPL